MKKIIVTGLCILILTLAACKSQEAVIYPMETDIYSPAVAALMNDPQIAMTVTVNTTLKYAGENIKEKENKELVYTDLSSEQPSVQVTGTVEYGDYQLDIYEYFSNDTLFLDMNDDKFSGSMDQESYLAKQVPVQLMNPALYGEITVSQTEKLTELRFSQAKAGEVWAMPENAVFKECIGTAALDLEGNLLSSVYEITYVLEDVTFTKRVKVQYHTPEGISVTAPNPEEYMPVQDIVAPMLIEKVYGYLKQTRSMDAELTESIFSEANTLQYEQTIRIDRSIDRADIETNASVTDIGRGGEISQYHQLESFYQEMYTITINDEMPQEQSRIDSQDMNNYCINLLTENILSPSHITDCTSRLEDGLLTVSFTAGEELAELVCQNSCQTIYQDNSFLDEQTDFYEEYAVSFTITLNANTGLPVSSGLDFRGIHHISGISYQLITNYSQKYEFDSE